MFLVVTERSGSKVAILALHLGHNATVVIGAGGVILSALGQEKLDNRKNSAAFPQDAIAASLAQCGLGLSDIQRVVIAGNEVYPDRCYDYVFQPGAPARAPFAIEAAKSLERGVAGRLFPAAFRYLRRHRQKALLSEGRLEMEANLERSGLGQTPRTHLDHHDCHARASYFALRDADDGGASLVFTADGSGDGVSSAVHLVDENGGWTRLAQTPVEASLGGIYSGTTRFLGMKILEHEYKVMGLAPYAKDHFRELYARAFDPVIHASGDGPLSFSARIDTTRFFEYLSRTVIGERFDTIAACVQHLIEERIVAWIRCAVRQTGISRIYTGGGLFMNVKMNMKIQQMPEVGWACFMPSCGDESNPIGAAYHAMAEDGHALQPLRDLYLGLGYDDAELSRFLSASHASACFEITEPPKMYRAVAELLAQGHIVARFSGRNEWGARSLGNRAILAHPSRMESFFEVNDRIKNRDFWMPFAPTILDYRARDYLVGYDPETTPARFMITAFEVSPQGRDQFCAAIHRGDGTLRPQVLAERDNPDYYRLLREFERLTGVGGVLNTSFNLHGSPMAASPDQAMETLRHSSLEYLALGPFLLKKRPASDN